MIKLNKILSKFNNRMNKKKKKKKKKKKNIKRKKMVFLFNLRKRIKIG